MNNRDYSKGKSNSNFIIKNVKSILIILSMFILLSISVIAATNVSILYGWNGTANVPIGVDAQGRLKTTMNLTKSIGLFPDVDSTRNLGTPSLKWGTLYVVDIVAAGSINVGGSLNATSINTTGDAYFATSSGSVGIGTTSPAEKLVVIGSVNISDSLNVSGTVQATTFIGDGSKLTGISTGQIWNSSGTNVFLNDSTAKVGIGTTSPTEILEVGGNVRVSGNITGTSFSINETSTAVVLVATGSKRLILTTNASTWT